MKKSKKKKFYTKKYLGGEKFLRVYTLVWGCFGMLEVELWPLAKVCNSTFFAVLLGFKFLHNL